MTTNFENLMTEATHAERHADDEALIALDRGRALQLPATKRLRWFFLHPILHRELDRVRHDVLELMEDNNDVSIVSVIGLSGVGKTTASRLIRENLFEIFSAQIKEGHLPVLYVEAPANGEKRMSWRVLYQRILHAGGAFAVPSMRAARIVEGRLVRSFGRASIPELREFIETMVQQRGVRVLIIDEALHLLRNENLDVLMDTLKSLSDIGGLKLLFIGSYDIAKVMTQYGQIARRAEIVHFQPYDLPDVDDSKQEQRPPQSPRDGESSSDAYEFYVALQKNLMLWPCPVVPDLLRIWWQLMEVCLGSVGLLKMLLLRLAALQMSSTSGLPTTGMLRKAGKSKKALEKLSSDLAGGREDLRFACYGESKLMDDYNELIRSVMAPIPQPRATAPQPESFHA